MYFVNVVNLINFCANRGVDVVFCFMYAQKNLIAVTKLENEVYDFGLLRKILRKGGKPLKKIRR